eukprot:9742835-Lingulodinium_polyedra.AAC.1
MVHDHMYRMQLQELAWEEHVAKKQSAHSGHVLENSRACRQQSAQSTTMRLPDATSTQCSSYMRTL